MSRYLYMFSCVAISVTGCKKPYEPSIAATDTNYLVVEGLINTGNDSTIFNLSRTVNVSGKADSLAESGAQLIVEGNNNMSYSIPELGKGRYAAAALGLDSTKQYRIRIKTANGKEYVSDFVPVVSAPPIDSVTYTIKNNGVQIYVNTHNLKNNTPYYRWDYSETWIFHSNYFSGYKSNGDSVIERNFNDDEIYQCWGNHASNVIVLGASNQLSKNVIADNPVAFIDSASEKIGNKYSILVRQYALTSDAYKFWMNLKKNTEQLGGIFDPQPSYLKGNVHSTTNPGEPVIGYISAGSTTSKRIFISATQLPRWRHTQPYPNCQLDSLYLSFIEPGSVYPPVNQENQYFNYNKGAKYNIMLIPVGAIYTIPTSGPELLIGHSGALPECVDCTLRGTNKQPAYWK